jgi:hypothetical protein
MHRSHRSPKAQWIAALLVCTAGALLGSCDSDSTPTAPAPVASSASSLPAGPTGASGCPACFAGSWRLQFTLMEIAVPSLCGAAPANLGVAQTISPVTFGADGRITFPAGSCVGCTGVVDAQGFVAVTLPGDGGTCPPGQLVARCNVATSCVGAGNQGGDRFTLLLNR